MAIRPEPELDTIVRGALIGAAAGLAGWASLKMYWKTAELLHGPSVRTLLRKNKGMNEHDVARQLQRERLKATEETIRTAEGSPARTGAEDGFSRSKYDVHWSYGVLTGAAYGALFADKEYDMLDGAMTGCLVWLVADEGLLSALGSRAWRAEAPVAHHVHRLGSHIKMGAVTGLAARALQGAFPAKPRTRRERAKIAVTDRWRRSRRWISDLV